MPQRRILLIDCARVISVSFVLLSHILITLGPPFDQEWQPSIGMGNIYWATWGQIGVTMFLVVSGLSLESAYGDRKMRFSAFYLRRVARIYPVYYMSLLIGLCVHGAQALWSYYGHGRSFVLLPGFRLPDVLLTLSGFSAFAGKWGGPLVWSSWFIGLIMMLYLLYPLISYGMKRQPWGCLAVLGMICATSRIATSRSTMLGGDPLQWFPLNRIFEFGLGIFLAQVIEKETLLRWSRPLERVPHLGYLSALSFPLFLIHDPLRRFIVVGDGLLFSVLIGIPAFLVLSFLLSAWALHLDNRISDWLKRKIGSENVRNTGDPAKLLA